MKHYYKKTIILIAICCQSPLGFATNFNDGINPDEPVQGKMTKDTNVEFIIQKATARIKSGNNKVISSDDGNAGIGNVIVGPGTNLQGAIIINQSENVDSAVISE
jgi:hypothetical protein